MPSTITAPNRSALPVKAETCAKANLRKAETYRQRVGGAVRRARTMRGWSLDELACEVHSDPRQVARWQTGDERPHFDALFAIDDALFRNALVLAFAELGTGVEIDTVIRLPIGRTA